MPPLTLSDWHAAYAAGASPRDRLEALRQRLADESPGAAWITRIGADALAARLDDLEARAAVHADRAAAMRALPLFGVPFAVKDNIDVAGLPTTAACPSYRRHVVGDANVVARLVAAGAVCLGKTNLDQFATGLVGTRSPYGRPSSACAADRISGGSSSGSAVVVARGDVPFALGTDTAGSGRVPAGFNNLVGAKPTPGRVGSSGVVPACRSLDCVSVLALTVADAARVLALIEGPDPDDVYSDFRTGAARFAPGGSVVGVPAKPVFDGADGGPFRAAWQASLDRLGRLGHRVVEIDFEPLFAVAALLYDGPWIAERHAEVQPLLERDPGAFDPTVRRVIESATAFSATDAFRAQYALQGARRRLAGVWNGVDALMVPTATRHPTHAEVDADPIGVNARLGTFTNFVNLLGWCALALPAAFTDAGLPFGVTFIGPAAADAALARLGLDWETSTGLPLGATGRRADAAGAADGSGAAVAEGVAASPTNGGPPPGRWPASEPTLPIAVVGAHLSGLPLNGQLLERGATLAGAASTAPHYRLYALPGTVPPKPGLLRVASGGAAVAVEVWNVPLPAVGSFLALIPAPLGLGSVELADGRQVHGFVCEAHAVAAANDITAFGGWRAYLASRPAPGAAPPASRSSLDPAT